MLRLILVTEELVLKFGFVVVKCTENAIYHLTLAPLNRVREKEVDLKVAENVVREEESVRVVNQIWIAKRN
jgi:hypothetical protein